LTENQVFTAGDPNWPTPFVGGGTPLLSNTNGTYYGIHTTPYSLQYTLSVQRGLPHNTLLTVGYQGTRGVHLLAFHDLNAPVPTINNGVYTFVHPDSVNPNLLDANPAPDPNLGSLDMLDTSSYSSYNALQVSVSHRLSSSFVFQFSVYTLPFKGNRWVVGWQITGIEAWHTGVPFSLGEAPSPI
jgi:hypothetical protein